MFNIASIIFKYLFIIIIYSFIFSIIRLIYLDLRGISISEKSNVYFKLLDMKDKFNFKVEEYYPIIEEETKIGRNYDNDIIIKDPFLSKNHLVVKKEGKKYLIEDLASVNGSYVNGEKVDEKILKNGDIVQIGQMQFIFMSKE